MEAVRRPVQRQSVVSAPLCEHGGLLGQPPPHTLMPRRPTCSANSVLRCAAAGTYLLLPFGVQRTVHPIAGDAPAIPVQSTAVAEQRSVCGRTMQMQMQM